jgi:pilus assembly protein FimV
MAQAVAEKTKIKDDEFDIHGDLAVTESDDKSFVVLYDSSKENPQLTPHEPEVRHAAPAAMHTETVTAPTLEDIDESHAMAPMPSVHPEDAYIDDILSSDDIDPLDAPAETAPAHYGNTAHAAADDDDGPIALSSEELDGILEMGPATEEEFHPDFPVEHASAAVPPEMPAAHHDETLLIPEAEHNFDDDELPIALSDEDLDEILLEEEGAHAPAPAAAAAAPHSAPVASSPAMTPPPASPFSDDLSDDEEPIALSDDELDNILADAEAGHTETHVSAPELLPVNDEDEVLTLDDGPEITMIDDGSPALGENSSASAATNEAGGFFDSDEDEPITLSDEELDGILSSAPEEEAPQHTDEVALAELPSDGTVEVEDDEPIALSNEELDGILMDAEEVPAADMGAEQSAAADEHSHSSDDFFDSDADEPIALSADELDGIAATAEIEDAPEAAPLAELPPEGMDAEGTASPGMDGSGPEDSMDAAPDATTPDPMAIDSRYADVDHLDEAPAAPADGDEDGPIALSTDELDGIVADSREVTPEAPMMPLSHMDSGADEPSLADNVDKPATVFEEDLDAATLIHEDEHAASSAPAPDTEELKSVMTYLDNLLGELPDDVIEKFAQSEYFKMYQKIMDKLGL